MRKILIFVAALFASQNRQTATLRHKLTSQRWAPQWSKTRPREITWGGGYFTGQAGPNATQTTSLSWQPSAQGTSFSPCSFAGKQETRKDFFELLFEIIPETAWATLC